MTNNTCPMFPGEAHCVEWMSAPPMHFDLAAGESFTVPACDRGVCLDCGETFTR